MKEQTFLSILQSNLKTCWAALPPVPGRAIWKSGLGMLEVQTPLLEWNETEELLKDHYTKESAKKVSVETPGTPTSVSMPTPRDLVQMGDR